VRHGGLTSGTDCVDAQELSFLCEVSVALISKEKQKHGHKEKESTKCAALVVVVQFKIAVT